MKKLFGIALIMFFFFGCSQLPPAIQDQNLARSPSAVGKFKPCKDTRDCDSDLSCRRGWCAPTTDKGEAGDSCFKHQDCEGGECSPAGTCIGNLRRPADNGANCNAGSSCRSGKCQITCRPTRSFPGFATMDCEVGSDCISGRCGADNRCRPGNDSLSCAWVGEKAMIPTECCSREMSNGTCQGRSVGSCGIGTDCSQWIGKICAGPGQEVTFETECCSKRKLGSVCVQDFSAPIQYCLKDSDCQSGKRCNPRNKTCEHE